MDRRWRSNLSQEKTMSPKKTLASLCALAVVAVPLAVNAATDNQTLTINATVSARAKLVLAPTVINFPDADPDLTPSIAATENSVNVLSNVRTTLAGVSTLTCQANGDLASGGDVIPITNVTWTAAGVGYVAGTMNTAVAQNVGSWTGSGANVGTMDFFLANSWTYNVGNYSQTVAYTLTAP
jgi:hypothetical protein